MEDADLSAKVRYSTSGKHEKCNTNCKQSTLTFKVKVEPFEAYQLGTTSTLTPSGLFYSISISITALGLFSEYFLSGESSSDQNDHKEVFGVASSCSVVVHTFA